jgi:hypothetical protein
MATVREQLVFDAMSLKSQEDVTASAERWRTGLAGLTAIITGGLLIKGPASAADLDIAWRAALTSLFGLGIASSVVGFWLALRASAGVPTTLRFDQLRRDFGSVRLYRLDKARLAERDLRRARAAALVSTGLLAVAVLTSWWAPAKPPDKPSFMFTHGGQQSCGTIVAGDASGIRLELDDNPTRITIPWPTITDLKPSAGCDTPR